MEVIVFKDDYLRMFSTGIETEYKGKSIVYDDKFKTLVYYYYTEHRRLYVLDGVGGDTFLPNIKEKVRIIAKFEDKEVNLFQKYLKSIIKSKKICYLRDEFFHYVKIIFGEKKPLFSDIAIIYNEYVN